MRRDHAIRALFLEHPRQLGTTYTEHGKHALRMAFCFATVALKLAAHAAVPAVFETAASDGLKELNEMHNQPPWKSKIAGFDE
jgi:hypothetical protein|tara:strand:+ start:495 stop:743 length:249 start_codon:yes stop_codon:yes gene_type:complete